jgi:hypothetical protein
MKNKQIPIVLTGLRSKPITISHETKMRVVLTTVGFVYGAWIAWMLCGSPI